MDCVLLGYRLAFSAADCLGYLDKIKVCVGYEIDGKVTDYASLPRQAREYVDFIESRIGYPIKMVSTGPRREDMTYRK